VGGPTLCAGEGLPPGSFLERGGAGTFRAADLDGETTMNRALPLAAAACLLTLTACGGADGESQDSAATSSAARTSSSAAATSTTPPPLAQGDVYACQSYVTDQGDAYEWLTLLEEQGTIGANEGFAGKLQVYNMGGVAQLFLAGVESEPLRESLQLLWDQQDTTRADLDAGTLSPGPLREALEQAAGVCEEGGFVISWHRG
jgi:hypothetical protein